MGWGGGRIEEMVLSRGERGVGVIVDLDEPYSYLAIPEASSEMEAALAMTPASC